jgi:hypothetical protein
MLEEAGKSARQVGADEQKGDIGQCICNGCVGPCMLDVGLEIFPEEEENGRRRLDMRYRTISIGGCFRPGPSPKAKYPPACS